MTKDSSPFGLKCCTTGAPGYKGAKNGRLLFTTTQGTRKPCLRARIRYESMFFCGAPGEGGGVGGGGWTLFFACLRHLTRSPRPMYEYFVLM